ncbi:hypothetical protein [Bradyrhizobium lablabi]|uniref:hypothetical protein n=1 Tax=Bradyrhizobium lablabi TaxID=722472 RepID=UPI001BA727A3|nr:hypothetical protein [Bradyrhizobium lablabi]MBR0692611.1 hypothetical protein [Bradyrhizobium lablabi]
MAALAELVLHFASEAQLPAVLREDNIGQSNQQEHYYRNCTHGFQFPGEIWAFSSPSTNGSRGYTEEFGVRRRKMDI